MAETKSPKKKSKAKKVEPKESKLSANEITDLIMDLSRSGYSAPKIGETLRSEHGVLNVKGATGKRIVQLLRENNLAPKLPPDIQSLIGKAADIRKHFATHRMDLEAKYGLGLTESKIRKLAKYYKRHGILPADWKYEAVERKA